MTTPFTNVSSVACNLRPGYRVDLDGFSVTVVGVIRVSGDTVDVVFRSSEGKFKNTYSVNDRFKVLGTMPTHCGTDHCTHCL